MRAFNAAAIRQDVLVAAFKATLLNMFELLLMHLITLDDSAYLRQQVEWNVLTCMAAADHTVPFLAHFANAASSFCSCSNLFQDSAPNFFTERFLRIASVMSAVTATRCMFLAELRMTAIYLDNCWCEHNNRREGHKHHTLQ